MSGSSAGWIASECADVAVDMNSKFFSKLGLDEYMPSRSLSSRSVANITRESDPSVAGITDIPRAR
jgi:hypothetical protein